MLFHHIFFWLGTNLVLSFSLIILVEVMLNYSLSAEVCSQKYLNWPHQIFSHQRVCWHHCCHSNLGLESSEHQLTEKSTRGRLSEVGSKDEEIKYGSSKKTDVME